MQTSINKAGQPAAFAGMLSDNSDNDVVSRFSAETVTEIPFGAGVQFHTVARSCKLLASGGVLMGVSVWGANHMPGTGGDLGTTGLKPKAGLQVLRRGRIWALVDKATTSIAAGTDRGYCRYTADGVTNPDVGAWAKADDSGKTLDATKQTQFFSGLFTAADGVTKIAELDVNFNSKP